MKCFIKLEVNLENLALSIANRKFSLNVVSLYKHYMMLVYACIG